MTCPARGIGVTRVPGKWTMDQKTRTNSNREGVAMGEQSNNGQYDQRHQRVSRQRCAKALAAAAVAVTGMLLRAPAASADVTIGADWTPVANSNGFTYYDGITNYSGNPLAQVDVNGNKWLQLDVSNAYWGQYTGQRWANSALAPDNFNNNPHLEFDLDVSQWHWGNLDYKLELGNDGSGGTQ